MAGSGQRFWSSDIPLHGRGEWLSHQSRHGRPILKNRNREQLRPCEFSNLSQVAWNLSLPNWQEVIRSGGSLVPKLPLDAAAANRAVRVFDKLRLPDVPGKPLLRDAAGDWFRDIVRALHGSIVDGERFPWWGSRHACQF